MGEVTSFKPYTGTGVMDDDALIAVGVDPDMVNHTSASTARLTTGHEDFFGGSITCPTCDGIGKVSRGWDLIILYVLELVTSILPNIYYCVNVGYII